MVAEERLKGRANSIIKLKVKAQGSKATLCSGKNTVQRKGARRSLDTLPFYLGRGILVTRVQHPNR